MKGLTDTELFKRREGKRVGVHGIERLLELEKPFGTVVLLPRMEIILDVKEDKKSDSYREKANAAVDAALEGKKNSVEEFVSQVARNLSREADSISRTELRLEADYIVYRQPPASRFKTQEMYKIISLAVSENGRVRTLIGAEVTGTTTCPCAQENLLEHSREQLEKDFSGEEIEKIVKAVPIPSHSQRNVSRFLLEVERGDGVEVEDLIKIAEDSMSSEVYEVLKRRDEVEVVLKSHRNPKFVEDVVRGMLKRVIKRYPELPDERVVFVRSESQESIHQHDAIAERATTLGSLREEFEA